MKNFILGKVLGKDQLGVPNLTVELWRVNKKNALVGKYPLSSSTTQASGRFRIDLRYLEDRSKISGDVALLLRLANGIEAGRKMVTPADTDDEEIIYEIPELEAVKHIEIWPRDYVPVRQKSTVFGDQLEGNPVGSPAPGSLPQTVDFASYVYLWPSPLEPAAAEDLFPLQQKFLIGAQILFRQEWHLLGHARGELTHSVPLAPGEETTVEILTWDRNIYKREHELSSELEREVEQNQQFKESREVINEMRKIKKWNVSGDGKVTILFVKVEANPGGYSEETQAFSKNTRNTIVEATDRAFTRIRDQRKTLISTTREFGKEAKVIRRLSNANLCHSITYHFYEILQSYRILTSLASPAARPCLFWKQDPPILREKLLSEPFQYEPFLEVMRWLHANSHLLAKNLLDRSFYKALELLPDLLAYWVLHRGLASTDVDLDPVLESPVRRVIVCAETLFSYAGSPPPGGQHWVENILANYMLTHMPWAFEIILRNQNSLKHQFDERDPQQKNAIQPIVYDFLNQWHERYATTHEAVRALFESETYRRFLYTPLLNLEREYTSWVYGPAPGDQASPEEMERVRDAAEVTRLLRHIYDNHLHYFQSIWEAKDPGQRLLDASGVFLPGDRALPDMITPNLLGFYADYAVFPLTNVAEGSELALLIESFLQLQGQEPQESQAVLPSNGIVIEPQLGDEMACEPFIQENRQLELLQKELELERYRIETQRRQKKIRNCQLENPDCCPSPRYGFFSRLLCRLRGKEG